MDVKFFYIKGYQPKGINRIYFYIFWLFIMILLSITLITILFSRDGIRDSHYLYIFVIVFWLFVSPFIKPKGLEIDKTTRTIRLVSLLGNFRLSSIRVSSVVSLDVDDESDSKIYIALVDGGRKTFYLNDRDSFVKEYNLLKDNASKN